MGKLSVSQCPRLTCEFSAYIVSSQWTLPCLLASLWFIVKVRHFVWGNRNCIYLNVVIYVNPVRNWIVFSVHMALGTKGSDGYPVLVLVSLYFKLLHVSQLL